MCACDVGAECMVVVGRLRERGLLPYLSRPCGVHAETGGRRTGAGGEALAFERSIISVGVIWPQWPRSGFVASATPATGPSAMNSIGAVNVASFRPGLPREQPL